MARHVTERAGLELVGCVDVDPSKAGRDAGDVIGLGWPLGFPVAATLVEALTRARPDSILHTTNSYFDLIKVQILEILAAGLDVVSTAEELSFPWLAHPLEAAEIDDAACQAGKTVLGTGINPGFIMDTLPLALTGICQRVDHVQSDACDQRIDPSPALPGQDRCRPHRHRVRGAIGVRANGARRPARIHGHGVQHAG